MENKDSILATVKQFLGLSEDVKEFDNQLIVLINSAFATLTHEGVGVENGYEVKDENNEWTEFVEDVKRLSLVKQVVPLKVKIVFDPPTNSSVLQAYERQIQELEWRLFQISGGY